VSYQWNFGDGQMGDGNDPNHTYAEPGVYQVCLIITDANGCVSDVCHEVVVEAGSGECNAEFTWEQIPGTLTVHFNSTSTSNFDIVSYQWNFGDGQMGDGNDPNHTYAEPGVYLVCLIITDANGCVSDVCHEVVVEAGPVCEAAFTFEESDNGEIFFFNNNSFGATDFTEWHWDFGDGNTSNEENPQHEYEQPGIYTVCLIMTDTTTGCEDDYCLELMYGVEPAQFGPGDIELKSTDAPTSLQNPDGVFSLRYTNPVQHELALSYYLFHDADVRIELFDMNGYRLIERWYPDQKAGSHEETLLLEQLYPGMYMLVVTIGEDRVVRLVVVTE
jgi:PKD repeat protein